MEYLGRVLSKMKCKIVEEVKILIFMNIILLSTLHAKLALRENWFDARECLGALSFLTYMYQYLA